MFLTLVLFHQINIQAIQVLLACRELFTDEETGRFSGKLNVIATDVATPPKSLIHNTIFIYTYNPASSKGSPKSALYKNSCWTAFIFTSLESSDCVSSSSCPYLTVYLSKRSMLANSCGKWDPRFASFLATVIDTFILHISNPLPRICSHLGSTILFSIWHHVWTRFPLPVTVMKT